MRGNAHGKTEGKEDIVCGFSYSVQRKVDTRSNAVIILHRDTRSSHELVIDTTRTSTEYHYY